VTTTNKDFRVKNGLIVEGNSATVNGNQVITSADAANYALKNAANTFTTSPQQINAASSAIGLIVKANATTPGDLQQWQNSADSVLAKVNSDGMLVVGNTTGTIQVTSSGTVGSYPSSGAGIELVAGSGSATDLIQAYNRNTNAWRSLEVRTAGTNFLSQIASSTVLKVKGFASQSANLQEWQNSAGTILSYVTSAGHFSIGAATSPGGVLGVSTGAAGARGIVVRSVASQTANLQEWQNSSGTVIASIGPAGSITTNSNITQSTSGRTFIGGATDYDAFLNVGIPTATRQGLVVRANASQSANIQEWQNSAGTVLSGINPAGQIYAGTTTSINGSTTTQITSRTFVSSTVATFGYSGTSLVQVGQRVTLSDFMLGEVDYNGTWPVTAVTSNSFTVLGSGFPNTFFGGGRFTVSSPASFVANTAVTTPIVVRGVASQTANLQEWQNYTGSPLLSINSAGQIQALQSSGLVVKASPTITATITNASGDGTAVFYTATNTFTPGQIVTITGVNPAAYNLSSVVISQAAGTYFSVENAATGTYVSGGTATVAQIANLQEWHDGSGTTLANVSSSGGFTVPSLTVSGDFTVNGTTTNINSTNLVVEDKNIVIGDTVTPTDITADGGGITLKGTTDKTFNWVDSTDSWTSSEHVNLASGKSLYLNGTLLKDATETLTNKTLTSPKINEDVAVTATATEINVLDGITSTTAELNILDGVTSTAAEINLLDGVTATTTELNYVDGVTSAIQTQIDAKAPLASPTFTGTVTIPANSAITGVPYLATANTFTGGVQQITTANAETIGLIVKSTESQTANLQEWHNFDGTARATLRPTGALNLGTLITGTQLSVTPFNNTTTGIVVRGAVSQSNDLQQWQNSAGTSVARVSSAGGIAAQFLTSTTNGHSYIQTGINGNAIGIFTNSAANTGVSVRAAASQTGDLQQWQNSASTVTSGINPAGQIYVGTTASINGSNTTAITSAAYTSATVAVFTYGGTSLVQAGQVVTVAGVTGGTYNGTWKVTAVTSTTFTVLGSGFTDVAGTDGTFTLSAVGSFVAGTAAITPIVVRGAASQTANLQEWQNSAGTILPSIGPNGTMTLKSVSSANLVTFFNGTSGFGAGNISYNGIFNINGANMGFPYAASGATLSVNATSATIVPITSRGFASQTGDLQQWQNSAGTVLASVSSSGGFTVPSLTVSGDFTVNGTTTNINTTNLVVEDKNIVIGDTVTPTDITADGGGITLKGTTDKTFNWVDATDSWTSSEHINLASGKSLKLDGTAIDLVSSTLNILTPTFTTNAYTVVLTDKDKWLELSNGATAGTLNIPTDATANFAIGAQIHILQTGAGQITIAAVTPGTTTVNGSPGLKLRGQWSVATIVKRAANTWVAVGDLSA
jgi:hypothetical protein